MCVTFRLLCVPFAVTKPPKCVTVRKSEIVLFALVTKTLPKFIHAKGKFRLELSSFVSPQPPPPPPKERNGRIRFPCFETHM